MGHVIQEYQEMDPVHAILAGLPAHHPATRVLQVIMVQHAPECVRTATMGCVAVECQEMERAPVKQDGSIMEQAVIALSATAMDMFWLAQAVRLAILHVQAAMELV